MRPTRGARCPRASCSRTCGGEAHTAAEMRPLLLRACFVLLAFGGSVFSGFCFCREKSFDDMSLRPWKSVMHHSLNWLTQVPCFFFRVSTTDRWDWAALRAQIAQHGVRNSLLVAPMPTASTAQILGAKSP